MTTDTQPIIDAATRAAEPTALDDSVRFHTVVSPEGDIKLIDLDVERDNEKYAYTPRRKRGTYQVHDAQSFVAYIAKHGDPDTEVWADAVAAKITGVLNAHEERRPTAPGPGARHEDHQVVYSVLLTDAWKAWAQHDGRLLGQEDLAEHFEARSIDIIKPSAEKGQLTIPAAFEIALKPFEGADPFRVTARFRYRITNGVLRIGYKLDRPEDVLRQAFSTVVENVSEGLDALTELELSSPILLGSR